MVGKQGQAGTQRFEEFVISRDPLKQVIAEEVSEFASIYLSGVTTLSQYEVLHIVGGILQRLDRDQVSRSVT